MCYIFEFLVCEHNSSKAQAKEVSMQDIPIIDHTSFLSLFYSAIYSYVAS